MGLPTLDDFLAASGKTYMNRAYVRFPGFKDLYVRYTRRFLSKEEGVVGPVIDIANLTASHPGNGAFTKLFQHLRSKYPEHWLYVECVLSPRFETKLLSLGFIRQSENLSKCFYMAPVQKESNAG